MTEPEQGATVVPRVADNLAALGLELPSVPAPVAAYVPAVRSGDLVFTSGQLPTRDGRLLATGKVGAEVSPDLAKELAARAALNAIAALASVADPDDVAAVVKVVGFVASEPDFSGQPSVVNGASELLASAYPGLGGHARSAVGVAVLPLDAPVEVEVVFRLRSGADR